MKQKIRDAVAGASFALLAAFFAAPSGAGAGPAALPVATVHIKGFAFMPSLLQVQVGQTVRFVNDDDDAHTVTSTTKAFESGGLDTGEAWSYIFAKPGTYAYFCALHPYMRATIVVYAKGARGETQ